MTYFETTSDDEEDSSADFWEQRQIGRIAAPIFLRNTVAAATKGRVVGAAELTELTTEQQSSMS